MFVVREAVPEGDTSIAMSKLLSNRRQALYLISQIKGKDRILILRCHLILNNIETQIKSMSCKSGSTAKSLSQNDNKLSKGNSLPKSNLIHRLNQIRQQAMG
jgi:hypothetical protein